MSDIKRNYQKELDTLISKNEKESKVPTLFLHACCAPCSSYVLEYLSEYFDIQIKDCGIDLESQEYCTCKTR